MADINELAEQWLQIDQDPETISEIMQLLEDGSTEELDKRLRTRIAFGTAGLRAKMEAGFSRMNSVTVIQASQGLAEYLISLDPANRERGIVIGRDTRHNSQKFAKLTAAAFLNKGFKVYYMGAVHTPLVPFAIATHSAAGGVMVTASHNPPADNGYKVYLGNGCQIIPPHDVGIAKSIEMNLEPLIWDIDHINYDNPRVIDGLKDVGGKYIQAVMHKSYLSRTTDRTLEIYDDRPLKFTYTPMHGVGLPYFEAVLAMTGHAKDMHTVKSQARPNPNFPTVKFPNPEEKGALDEAKKTADTFNDTLILATDPDADRFAAAEKVDGEWHQFTGNQMGVLLASFLWETFEEISNTDYDNPNATEAVTIRLFVSAVSSRMLFTMAPRWAENSVAKAKVTFEVEETLTGFKWLGNRAKAFTSLGPGNLALFGYEEAIGYMNPLIVNDKDGVSAAATFLAACRTWRSCGLTPWQKLHSLYDEFGHFAEANTYLISPSPAVTTAVFTAIRKSAPTKVGPREILRIRDLTLGTDTGTEDGKPTLPTDPGSQMLTCWLSDDVVFTVRGSGTEPKIKIYIEARSGSSLVAKVNATTVLDDLMAEWFRPEEFGLVRA